MWEEAEWQRSQRLRIGQVLILSVGPATGGVNAFWEGEEEEAEEAGERDLVRAGS